MGILISRWIGAGLLAFGMVVAPTALLGVAGVAYADTGTESDGGKPASQDSPEPQEPQIRIRPSRTSRRRPRTTIPNRSSREPAEETDGGPRKPTVRSVERVRDHVTTSRSQADDSAGG